MEGYKEDVNALAVTSDGKQIVSGIGPYSLGNKTNNVWDLQSGHLLRSLEGFTDGTNCVAITPDCKKVISGSRDKIIQIWNLQTGSLLNTLEGHTGQVNAVAITPDGKQVISGSDDNTIQAWNLETGEPHVLFHNSNPINSLATDNHWLVCGDEEGHVWIFEWLH